MKTFTLILLTLGCAFAQAVYIEPPPALTVSGNPPAGSFPTVLAASGALISVCDYPACASFSQTYTDATAVTPCPTNMQAVLPGTATCTNAADSRGNFGFWLLTGGQYQYKVTLRNGVVYGPYPITMQTNNAANVQMLGIDSAARTVQNLTDPALGAALVATKQTGAGAATRSVKDALNDFENVKSYGAKADGSNDSAAIALAYTAAKAAGRLVYFPAGTYSISSPLPTLDASYTGYVCESPATTIQYTGGTTSAIVTDNGNNTTLRYGLRVENCTILGNGNVSYAVSLHSVHHSRFASLRLGNVVNTCLRAEFAVANTYEDVSCSNNDMPGLAFLTKPVVGMDFAGADANHAATASTVLRPIVETVSGSGIKFGFTNYMVVTGGTSESNNRGLEVYNTTFNLTVIGTDFEANTVEDVLCSACYYSTFLNINSQKLFNFAVGRGVILHGGQYKDITINANGHNAMLDGALYTGTLTNGQPDETIQNGLIRYDSGTFGFFNYTRFWGDVLDIMNRQGSPTVAYIRASAAQGSEYLLKFTDAAQSTVYSQIGTGVLEIGSIVGKGQIKITRSVDTTAGYLEWYDGSAPHKRLGYMGASATNVPLILENGAKWGLSNAGEFSKTISVTDTLNAAAPAGVPGCSADLTTGAVGAAIGDTVSVAGPVALPAGFVLQAFVSAADTVKIRWCQFSGVAADPDGAGGTYRVDLWKH